WLQYGLLGTALPAVVKMALVFSGALLASWGASAALCRIPAVAAVIGGGRRAIRLPPARHTVGIAD
ncbi:MAG TPA: hypothetical protein VJR70_09455, partial [Stellaceae bacterium]|nr:hypothetical protein [Stellaceae bacterium]